MYGVSPARARALEDYLSLAYGGHRTAKKARYMAPRCTTVALDTIPPAFLRLVWSTSIYCSGVHNADDTPE